MIRACTVTGCDRTLTVKYTAVTVYGYPMFLVKHSQNLQPNLAIGHVKRLYNVENQTFKLAQCADGTLLEALTVRLNLYRMKVFRASR